MNNNADIVGRVEASLIRMEEFPGCSMFNKSEPRLVRRGYISEFAIVKLSTMHNDTNILLWDLLSKIRMYDFV
jgi:hypothetical protein